MKPLMYGYMRAPDDVPDDELERTVQEMRRFAETEGFCYVTTFFEFQDGSRAAFSELIQELKRAEARHVVVPSLVMDRRDLSRSIRPRAACVVESHGRYSPRLG